MRRLAWSLVPTALVCAGGALGATPTPLPDRFDMICKGKTEHLVADKRSSPSEKWSGVIKIDRQAGLYCDGHCLKPNRVGKIEGPVMMLHTFSTGLFLHSKAFDTLSMRYTQKNVTSFGIILKVDQTSAKCRVLPFTGLPAVKPNDVAP